MQITKVYIMNDNLFNGYSSEEEILEVFRLKNEDLCEFERIDEPLCLTEEEEKV